MEQTLHKGFFMNNCTHNFILAVTNTSYHINKAKSIESQYKALHFTYFFIIYKHSAFCMSLIPQSFLHWYLTLFVCP